jgi:hypothetical protein
MARIGGPGEGGVRDLLVDLDSGLIITGSREVLRIDPDPDLAWGIQGMRTEGLDSSSDDS